MTGLPEEHAARPRRGLFLAPFDELVDPLLLAELAVRAEARGWDGLFLWDHIAYSPPVRAVADPWVVLSAIAVRTRRLRLGPGDGVPANGGFGGWHASMSTGVRASSARLCLCLVCDD